MIRIKNYIADIKASVFNKAPLLFVIAMLLPALANAQPQIKEMSENEIIMLVVMGMVFIVFIIVLGVAFYALTILRLIVGQEKKDRAESEGVEYKPEPSLWKKLAGTEVEIQEESSILLDHNYDGIRELDNHLPPWWKYLFYLTIVFAVIYVFVYHVSDSLPLQEEEYRMEVALAEQQSEEKTASEGVAIDESNIEYSDEAAILSNGEKVYNRTCAVCHAPDGGGGVGPNLVDEYWLHGGGIKDIFKSIKYGIPDKGMIAWESQLSAANMRDLSCYIVSLKGTTPASPKDPQGEKYEE
ncbi:MAG: c-type cytochrome [Cyclobacteriaceae bacterium]